MFLQRKQSCKQPLVVLKSPCLYDQGEIDERDFMDQAAVVL
jgi:hypothetical protein